MKACSNCIHWVAPKKRKDWQDIVQYYDPQDWAEARRRQAEGDKLFGMCTRINMKHGRDLKIPEEPPLAMPIDGSDYKADFFTRAEFSCALHEGK